MAGDDQDKKQLPQDFPEDLRHFDEGAVADHELLKYYGDAFGVDVENMRYEDKEQVILLGRMQLFVEAKRAFLHVHYDIDVTPDTLREMKDYFQRFMDVVMPPGTPERIAFEVSWQQHLIAGYRTAQEKIERVRKNQGHPPLLLPKKGLLGPGGNPLNGSQG